MTVKFKDNSAKAKDTMVLLEKKALQESAKIARKALKKNAPVEEGVYKKNIGTWVRRKGNRVWLQVGVYNKQRARKRGYKYAYHAHLIEFGTVKVKANPVLGGTIRQIIPEIRAKQAEYLSYLDSEAKALQRQANNNEEVKDDWL